MRVEPYEGTEADWDLFVRRQPGWTHFHLWGWGRVVQDTFGHETAYLAARDDTGELVGVLPLVWVRSRLFGRFLVSMPFLNYGGPLGTTESIRALVASSIDLLEDAGDGLLELRARGPLDVALPASTRKITVLLDLPAAADVLWRDLPAKVRSQVRRPQKEGLEPRFDADEVRAFYTVFSRHMRDLGTPVLPIGFFEAIAEEFGEEVCFGCVYHEGRPVAAGCAFRSGDELELAWASALRSHSRMAPNMLLYWSFMDRAIADGCRVFNFGRCSAGSGTHRFKRQWGGRDEQLHWYHHSTGGIAKTPSPDDRAYSWGPRIWSRLPLALANRLGPAIVKYIP